MPSYVSRGLIAIGLVGALAACAAGSAPSAPTPAPLGTVHLRPLKPVRSLKPPIRGIVLEAPSQLRPSDGGLVGGIVATVPWASLQRKPGGRINGSPIDRVIQVARRFNHFHPAHPIYVKIRVLAGIDAPQWAKTLNGFTPISTTNRVSGQTGTVGPFWKPVFGAAYRQLERELAARYDTNPMIRDVAISRCTTIFAEPFQRDDTNTKQFYAEGYTAAADRKCLRSEIGAHAVWHYTHQSLAANPFKPFSHRDRPFHYDMANAAPSSLPRAARSLKYLHYCRKRLRRRCTLENNSIRSSFVGLQHSQVAARHPALPKQYGRLYHGLVHLGPPLTFQTAAAGTVGSLPATVRWAIRMGANSVEIPLPFAPRLMRIDNRLLRHNRRWR